MRRARRPLLEREDKPADRGEIVVGGGGKTALRRRPCRAPRANEWPRRRRGALNLRLGEFQRRLRSRFLRRLCRLFALRLAAAFALALLGLEPLRERGTFREIGVSLAGGSAARLFFARPDRKSVV